MNRENKIAEPSGEVGSTAINAACQIFSMISVFGLYGVLSDIDKGSSTLYHGENACDEFVSDDIDRGHLGFSVGQPSGVVFPHLRVAVDGAHGRQMEHPFHLFIGYGAYLRSAAHTRTGLILKRRSAGITGEFAPIVKSGEVVGVDNQVAGNDQPDAFDTGHKFKSGP